MSADDIDRDHVDVDGYDYRRESGSDFQSAVEAVEEALSRHGFTILVVHDIQATLASKGFSIKPIRIYEVDASGRPSLRKDAAGKRLASLMPCRVNVFVEEDRVVVTALRPTLLCRVFPEERFGDAAAALETVLVAVVDEAVA